MSTAKFNTLQNAAGTKSVPVDTVVDGSAKAWVNFNGTGTVAIRASFNVSSITDNGTGDYTVNFTTTMPDANYGAAISVGGTTPVDVVRANDQVTARTASALRILALSNSFSPSDAAVLNVSIFR